MLFLFGWPPCQRSDMTLVEVFQHAYNYLCIRTVVLFVFLWNPYNLIWYLYIFLLNKFVWVWVWVWVWVRKGKRNYEYIVWKCNLALVLKYDFYLMYSTFHFKNFLTKSLSYCCCLNDIALQMYINCLRAYRLLVCWRADYFYLHILPSSSSLCLGVSLWTKLISTDVNGIRFHHVNYCHQNVILCSYLRYMLRKR